jgi:bifunctional non-homologous end joining protein LigD
MPTKLRPQLASLVDEAPAGNAWLHEIKFDGYRMLARIADGKGDFISRNANDWSAKFPELAKLLPGLPVTEAILDGEVCAMLPSGATGFGELQAAIADKKTAALVYFIFDLVYLDGWRLDRAALVDRKALLATILDNPLIDDRLRYSDHHVGQGPEFFAQVKSMGGLEGIVSKRANDPYRPGRSLGWLKVKANQREEFIVIGWTDPEGSRIGFGRLVLGYYSPAMGALTYAGGVGTGFNDKMLAQLHKRLLAIPAPDLGIPVPKGVKRSAIHWVRPEIVAQVRFTEWTRDGILRHPSFLGERLDKRAEEVVLDRAMSPDAKQHHWVRGRRR